MTEHTPWVVSKDVDHPDLWAVRDADNLTIVLIDNQNDAVDIVRAVNSHAKMVEALKRIVAEAEARSDHANATNGGLDGWNDAEAQGAERCADIASAALKATQED